ncbi:MAG: hemolysin family protein [Candidatus Goldiibacteriota bacterium]
MTMIMQVQILLLIMLFITSAVLSVAETSLIGLSKIKAIAFIRNKHPKAKYFQVWVKEPQSLLATFSICINAVAITAATIGAFLSLGISEMFGLNASLTASVMAGAITATIIIFGEISPKIFAIHNTEKLSVKLVGPAVLLYKILKPVTALFVKIANLTIKILGGEPGRGVPVVTAKDISTVIDVSSEEGFIGEQEKSMMASILEFGDTQAKHIMVPRTSVEGIDVEWDFDKIIDVVIEDGYSRMPVYKENMDNILGVLYTKDMMTMIKNRDLIIFEDLVRMPYFVPEYKNIAELLKEFKKGKIHMAIVVDEFGGTAGLITLEDILEEIVGEIQDEYDMEYDMIKKIGDDVYELQGALEIDELNEEAKINIPEEDDINTIGGFVMALFGKVPQKGESMNFGYVNFTILKSDARKVEKILMKVSRPAEEEDQTDNTGKAPPDNGGKNASGAEEKTGL